MKQRLYSPTKYEPSVFKSIPLDDESIGTIRKNYKLEPKRKRFKLWTHFSILTVKVQEEPE